MGSAKVAITLHVAGDGQEAIDFLCRQGRHTGAPRPDLVLLDLDLPERNGREVLATVKADPGLRVIPIIMLTSSSADDDIVACYDLHANSYVTKPNDPDDFVDMVSQVEAYWLRTAQLPA